MENVPGDDRTVYDTLLDEVHRLRAENEQLRISSREKPREDDFHESGDKDKGSNHGNGGEAGQLERELEALKRELSLCTDENASLKEENEMLMEEIRTQIRHNEAGKESERQARTSDSVSGGVECRKRHSVDEAGGGNSKRARILELKDNPVSRYRWVSGKMNGLLRAENDDLLNKTLAESNKVPLSSYKRLEYELKMEKKKVASSEKMMDRLKDKYNHGIRRFIEVVYKVLGYKIEFVTDWRVKIVPRLAKECSIGLDMSDINVVRMNRHNIQKLDSGRGGRIVENLLKFWILDKRELSCFFSSLNLELYERKKVQSGLDSEAKQICGDEQNDHELATHN